MEVRQHFLSQNKRYEMFADIGTSIETDLKMNYVNLTHLIKLTNSIAIRDIFA